jgi:hypothetical protein
MQVSVSPTKRGALQIECGKNDADDVPAANIPSPIYKSKTILYTIRPRRLPTYSGGLRSDKEQVP